MAPPRERSALPPYAQSAKMASIAEEFSFVARVQQLVDSLRRRGTDRTECQVDRYLRLMIRRRPYCRQIPFPVHRP